MTRVRTFSVRLALFLTASAALLAPQIARADAISVAGMLPTARYLTSAVHDGSLRSYVFGGTAAGGVVLDQIIRYDGAPATQVGTLPTPRSSTSAIWSGSAAYIFGGINGPTQYPNVLRYDAGAPSAVSVGVLPSARSNTSAVWTGQFAYVFGGSSGGVALSEIVQYDVATNNATVVGSLPARYGTSAVWTGQYAYVFGGFNGSALPEIVRFDPVTNASVVVGTLPSPRFGTSAIWDGQNAYVFGGTTGVGALNEIVRFNPTTGVTVMPTTLPSARLRTSAVWDGSASAYIFGGENSFNNGVFTAEILRYTSNRVPTAPLNLSAIAGPGAGQVTLNWQPPLNPGSSPVTGYRILRGTSSGSEVPVASTGNVLTFVDQGLPPGSTWFYQVRATNSVGDGPVSNERMVTTFAWPGAPTGLAASPGPGAGQITLNWQPPANTGGTPITGYKIYRGTASGSLSFVVQVPGTQTTFTDSGLGDGATRYYKVSAVNIVGEGAFSNEASATTYVPPGAPQLAQAEPGTNVGQITLTWQPPVDSGSTPIIGYRIYRGTASGSLNPIHIVQVPSTQTTFTDVNRTPLTNYYYAVSAVNGLGVNVLEGPRSAETCNKPYPWLGFLGCI